MALLWFWCCLAADTDAIYADAALADDDAVATGANAVEISGTKKEVKKLDGKNLLIKW